MRHIDWKKLEEKYPRLSHEDAKHYSARLVGAEFYERQFHGNRA
jgi:hypothetical protein